MKQILRLVFVSGLVFLSGCGYTQEVQLPGGIKTVAVHTFKNEIPPKEQFAYRPGLEIELTNAIIDRIIFDGNLKVVDESKADAILEGSIISFEQEDNALIYLFPYGCSR